MRPGVGTTASWYFFIFGMGLKVSAALTPSKGLWNIPDFRGVFVIFPKRAVWKGPSPLSLQHPLLWSLLMCRGSLLGLTFWELPSP